MKRVITFALVLAAALTVLCSCGKGKIEGCWRGTVGGTDTILCFNDGGEGRYYIVAKDGSMYFNIKWKTEGSTITLSTSETDTASSEFSVDGDTLTMDGQELERIPESELPSDATDATSILKGQEQ